MNVGHLHPSSMADWQGCGKRFWLSSVERVRPEWRHPATLNGTAIHSVIESIHSLRLWDASREDLAPLWSSAFDIAELQPSYEEEKGVLVWWGEYQDRAGAKAAMAADALDMLDGYRTDLQNRNAEVLAAEARWRATFGGFDWEGTLDQARAFGENTVEVVDFKSGRERLTGPAFRMWPQGLSYALALAHALFRPLDAPEHAPWKSLNLDVTRVTWLHLRDYIPYKKSGHRGGGTPYVKGERKGPAHYSLEITPKMLEEHAKEVSLFAKAVEAGRFERRPSNYQCSRCKVAERCLRDFTDHIDGLDPSAAILEESDAY